MEKVRLDLDALEAESFAVMDEAADEQGTVDAHQQGPTRRCLTPDCTAGTDCL
ncbi:MAG TPA: hypothetical protein VFQ45_23770 [Longimicrobium sp.]|nr:hypothetical protein [Longimicrobium sp.]